MSGMFTNHSWTLVMDPTPSCAVVVVSQGIILDTSEMCRAERQIPKVSKDGYLGQGLPIVCVGKVSLKLSLVIDQDG